MYYVRLTDSFLYMFLFFLISTLNIPFSNTCRERNIVIISRVFSCKQVDELWVFQVYAVIKLQNYLVENTGPPVLLLIKNVTIVTGVGHFWTIVCELTQIKLFYKPKIQMR